MLSYRIGDCSDLILQENEHLDALVTDPPYNIQVGGAGGIAGQRKLWGGGQLTNLGADGGYDVTKHLNIFNERIKPFVGAVMTQKKGLHQMIDWAEARGYHWDILSWHKPLATPLCNAHAPLDTEWVVYIHETGAYLPKTFKEWGQSWYIEESYRRKYDFEHPTIKPLELMKRLVIRCCPKGGTVLDPFAGTGTTLKAAQATGRNAIGYEINPKWQHYLERITNDNLLKYVVNAEGV